MGLFKRLFSKRASRQAINRSKLKVKRPVAGKTSIAQKDSPYLNKPLFGNFRKKRVFKRSPGMLIDPPARLKQNKPSKIKKIILCILCLFILGGSVYLLFFTDIFLIDDYQIYDDGTQITNNLPLNSLITQSLLNQNLLVYNADQLTQEILDQNPQYKAVVAKKVFPHSIKIDLEKYPVAANIINQIISPDGLNVQKKFLVNSNGMIIMENDENPELPYIKVSTEQAFSLNEQPLTQAQLEYIIKLTNLFEEKFGIKVVEAEYLKKAREIHLRTEKDFTVWFDINKDMVSQIDKLKRALLKLDIYKTPLEYIDLRISGTNAEKVIYKKR